MRTLSIASLLVTGALATPAVAAPVIDSIGADVVPLSGRIEILGSGFGARPLAAGARVEIGGVEAATSTWQDDRITAYASAGVPLGPTVLRVVTPDGTSADVTIEVEPLPAAADGVAWSFVGDGGGGRHRPAVAPDGTVYTCDGNGFLHAFSPTGELLWIRDGLAAGATAAYSTGNAGEGPVALGADGTIYVPVNLLGPENQIQAWAPDGTVRWIYREETGSVLHGPSIGPDGNLYVSFRGPTGGLRVIAPDGSLLHRRDDDRAFIDTDAGIGSAEILFGSSVEGAPVDRLYLASAMPAPAEPSHGSLLAYALDTDLDWIADAGSHRVLGGQQAGQPALRADGSLVLSASRVGEGFGVHAFARDGEQLWSHIPADRNVITEVEADDAGNVFVITNTRFLERLDESGSLQWKREIRGSAERGPIVQPGASAVTLAGVFQEGAAVMAVEIADGALGWRVELPQLLGQTPEPSSRLRFTDDGARAYVESGLGTTSHWALFAIDPPTPTGGTGGTGGGGTGGTGGAGGSGGSGGSGSEEPTLDETTDDAGGCSTSGSNPEPLVLAAAVAALVARRRRAH